MIKEKISINDQEIVRKIQKEHMLSIQQVIEELYTSPIHERMYFDGEIDVYHIIYGYETKGDGSVVFWNNTEDVIVAKNSQVITPKEKLLSYL